ncbi:hypothetical protein ACFVQ9_25660 [Streptomyces goshikiensis]|uniref:hypothetical protein n=1 Tax=Streptomyces goshikiensis TaxID=1942 RepID=UPI0036D061F2
MSLMCVWEMCDAFGFGGNSEFYVQAHNGDLHALVGDLWAWLNGDTQDAATLDGPGARVPPLRLRTGQRRRIGVN